MKKVNPVLTECPVCKNDLKVVELKCDNCKTKIEGEFSLSKFNYLDKDKLYFIEVFLKNRGSIKAIEKELNISYPTVKKMLDEVVVALGYKVEEEEKEEKFDLKKSILDQVEKGEIKVKEALELLKGKKRKDD